MGWAGVRDASGSHPGGGVRRPASLNAPDVGLQRAPRLRLTVQPLPDVLQVPRRGAACTAASGWGLVSRHTTVGHSA